MTTYTAIADTEIDKDSPLTAPIMTRLRDNPTAISEGRGPTTPSAGDVVLYRWGGEPFGTYTGNHPSWLFTRAGGTTISEDFYVFRFMRAGTYRITWGGGSQDAAGSGGDTYLSLYRDIAGGGTALIGAGLTFVDGGGGTTTFVEQAGTTTDVTFAEGDSLFFNAGSRSGRGVGATYLRISADAFTAPIGA